MHPGMQVRLLRVLQDGEIRPLGSSDTRKVDVRIIAATNRDLRKEAEEGRFREDLYYRLRVVEIELPPLRERRSDIPMLAHHFLDASSEKMGRKLKAFTNSAMDRLVSYSWRGNVRELENEIERTVALAGEAETVTVDMLSDAHPGRAPRRRPEGGGAADGARAHRRRRRAQAPPDPGRDPRDRQQDPRRRAARRPAPVAPEDDEAAGPEGVTA